jgi:NTE family protein
MIPAAAARLAWRLRPPVLALGGGGARGFAHIGVLLALDDWGLTPHAIVGTSMGSVVGGMYLALGSAEAVAERWRTACNKGLVPSVRPMGPAAEAAATEHPLLQAARRIRDRVVISLAVNRATMLDGETLVRAIEFLVPDIDIGDLPKPFVAVATDLETGAEVRLAEGSLRTAMVASSSIPGLFPSVEVNGRPLVDGAVVSEVPIPAGRALGRRVVAVPVEMELPPLSQSGIALDTMMRTQMMTSSLLVRQQLHEASTVVRPSVGCATWSEWQRMDDLVEAGRRAVEDWLGTPDRKPAGPPVAAQGAGAETPPTDGSDAAIETEPWLSP